MKRFFICMVLIFICSLSYGQDLEKDPPVKTWKEVKYVGNRPIEVLKIQLKSGKVIEIYPTVKKVPKPESSLPREKSGILIGALVFLTIGISLIIVIFKRVLSRKV